jgi:hypothetical protein
MNTTKNAVPMKGSGSFASSGFFTKLRERATKPTQVVYRKSYEAATPAQAARLSEVLGHGMSSHLRF